MIFKYIHVNQSSRVCWITWQGGRREWQFYVLFILRSVTFYASIVCVWWWLLFCRHWLLTYSLASVCHLWWFTYKKHRLTASMFVDCLYWEMGDELTWQGRKRTARRTKTDSDGQSKAYWLRKGTWVNSQGADCFGLLWTRAGQCLNKGLCVIPELDGPSGTLVVHFMAKLWRSHPNYVMGRGWSSGSKELITMNGRWTNSLTWVPGVIPGDERKDDLVNHKKVWMSCESLNLHLINIAKNCSGFLAKQKCRAE